MEIRGDRRCRDCGARWSYYETGAVECPECGSLRSTGVEDERRLHTDAAVELDLDEARVAVAERPAREAAGVAADAAGEYVRKRGFVRGGDLRDLDGTYLAAAELRRVAATLERALEVTDDEEAHFVALLTGAPDGDRPAPEAVPESLRAARGLAVAAAVHEFRRDAADWLERRETDSAGQETDSAGRDADPAGREADQADRNADSTCRADAPGRAVLERLDEHARRVEALDGEVPPADADRLASAARDVAAYLRDGDEAALDSAHARVDRLADAG